MSEALAEIETEVVTVVEETPVARRERRCKVCRLPDDIQSIITRYILDDGVSLSKVAKRVNPLIEQRHIQIEPLSIRNLSTHFRYHTTPEQRAAYEERNMGRPAKMGGLEMFEAMVSLVQDNQGVIEDISTSLDHTREAADKVMMDLQKKVAEDDTPLSMDDIAAFVAINKEIRATAKALRDHANPRLILDLFLDTCLKQLSRNVVKLHHESYQALEKELALRFEGGPRKREVRELVREHRESSKQELKDVTSGFETTVSRILAR